MRAFVTGGTVFIGRQLVSRLRARGDDVTTRRDGNWLRAARPRHGVTREVARSLAPRRNPPVEIVGIRTTSYLRSNAGEQGDNVYDGVFSTHEKARSRSCPSA